MRDDYAEIERVVVDTFSQWDLLRVGFSWRKYYLDHTLQVMNLSLRMAREMDADPEQLRFAAILHDVTKRYDGAIRKDPSGKTLLDGEGFWLNETISPDRENWVTRLYDRLGLHGQIHHVSGAIMTDRVLREFGFGDPFIKAVSKIVAGHLKGEAPPEVLDVRYREPEVRILYDADTIDPNVGLTAFYRNVQITAGYALQNREAVELRSYIGKLPRWIGMKSSFQDQMLTDRGREICGERHQHLRHLVGELESELLNEAVNRKYGLLGVVEHLLTHPEDPSLREHARLLEQVWLPEREKLLAAENELDRDQAAQALARSKAFNRRLQCELSGDL